MAIDDRGHMERAAAIVQQSGSWMPDADETVRFLRGCRCFACRDAAPMTITHRHVADELERLRKLIGDIYLQAMITPAEFAELPEWASSRFVDIQQRLHGDAK